jgi:uncharacterized membrane protein YhaH (DUF805 family)
MFSFQGRVSRKKFWQSFITVLLFNIFMPYLVKFVLVGLFLFVVTSSSIENFGLRLIISFAVYAIFIITLVIPLVLRHIAITCKRYHDLNKSGWWTLIILVPILGALWTIYECGFLKGTDGPNQYGPDPLAPVDTPQPTPLSQSATSEQVPPATTLTT